ncbi:HAD family hydrolase [Agitococcus lubricus]|nr:HAD family hydrolase [Agitococcus lubricus]
MIIGLIWYLAKQHKVKPVINASSPTLKTTEIVFSELQVRTGFSSEVVLHVAASLAQGSSHPLSQAIVHEAQKRQLPIKPVSEFQTYQGYGLTGLVDGRIIALGNLPLMQELGINIPAAYNQLHQTQAMDVRLIYISVNSYLAGVIFLTSLPQ